MDALGAAPLSFAEKFYPAIESEYIFLAKPRGIEELQRLGRANAGGFDSSIDSGLLKIGRDRFSSRHRQLQICLFASANVGMPHQLHVASALLFKSRRELLRRLLAHRSECRFGILECDRNWNCLRCNPADRARINAADSAIT